MLANLLFFSFACKDVEDPHDHHHHDHELITAVVLDFENETEQFSYKWSDPLNDGNWVADDVILTAEQNYDLTLSFLNELEEPVEDITPEIADEDLEHQIFFTGPGIQGPSTGDNPDALLAQEYADEDSEGNPLGLENTISFLATGDSEFVVTLRHMPFENDQSIKGSDAAETVANEGFDAIGGANDVQVTFNLLVE